MPCFPNLGLQEYLEIYLNTSGATSSRSLGTMTSRFYGCLLLLSIFRLTRYDLPVREVAHKEYQNSYNKNDLVSMIGEMCTYVQGVSLKVCIADLLQFFELPDHQNEKEQ